LTETARNSSQRQPETLARDSQRQLETLTETARNSSQRQPETDASQRQLETAARDSQKQQPETARNIDRDT